MELCLQTDDLQLRDGRWLNNKHINFAQSLLKKQFPHIDKWKETLLFHKMQKKIKQGVQIIHTRCNHRIVASTLKCDGTEVFVSLYTSVDMDTQNIILNIFQITGKPKLRMAEMCKQDGVNDCGLLAIATATAL